MTEAIPGYRTLLPRPSTLYSESDQQNLRYSIQRALDYKLNRNESPVFGGIPFAFFKGSNPNFAITNTDGYVRLPATDVYKQSDKEVVLSAAGTFSPLTTADWLITAKLVMVSGGSNTISNVSVGLYANGEYVDEVVFPFFVNGTTTIRTSFPVFNINPNKQYDVRFTHTNTSPVYLDLTASYWGTTRLSSFIQTGQESVTRMGP